MVADLPLSPSIEHHKRLSLADERAIAEEETGETNGVTETNGSHKDGGIEEKEKKKKPPPTQFVEPSANSLLDSFGF